MERIQTNWNNQINAIPTTSEQRIEAERAKRISKGLFEEFGLFTVIDGIVQNYPAYTHDDVYKMEWPFVISLDILGRKKAYLQAKQSEERQKER